MAILKFILGSIVTFVLQRMFWKRAGREEERQKQTQEGLKRAKKRIELEEDNAGVSDDELDRRLREHSRK